MTVETLLPQNATAFERSMEQGLAHYGDAREVLIDTLWRPADCPEAVLPFLAWGLGVRNWNPGWPEATRRRVVAEALSVHRRRGTPGAIRAVLDAIGADADVEERPGGAAFMMDICITNSAELAPGVTEASIRAQIDDAKRASVHYILALTQGLGCSSLGIAAAVRGVQVARVALTIP